MTHLDFDGVHADIEGVKRSARYSARVQRVQVMALAACLTTLGVVGVAGALLTNML